MFPNGFLPDHEAIPHPAEFATQQSGIGFVRIAGDHAGTHVQEYRRFETMMRTDVKNEPGSGQE
jgi:hypothetical protein